LMTMDTEAAKAFYGKVVGWGTQDASMPGMPYTLFTAAGALVGGLMDLPQDARQMGAPPSWIGYVAVDDVDAAAEQVKHLGGAVHVAPRDVPNIARFAVIADLQGATIALFKSLTPRRDPPAAPGTPGHVGWHELAAVDWEKAFAFYSALFGWQKADAVDMGANSGAMGGTYQLFSTGGPGPAVGGMFNKPAAVPRPFWLYYINVGGIDGAVERVKEGGGTILNGPMQVPGGSWIVQCRDPQGAMFALVGNR
jgi:uncharacterized protein